MGIMNFLRNRAGVIIVAAIGFAIVAFLIGDAVQTGGSLLRGNQNEVGEVDGEAIVIQEFNERVEQNTNNFRQQMGGNMNAQMTSYIVENSWNQAISELLLNKEVKRLGIQVSRNELNDMITGKNPHPQVVQSFADPQTGQVNRTQLNAFLTNLDTQPADAAIRGQWNTFLNAIRQDRLSQKYNNLVQNSLYVTSLEAQEDYKQRNQLASFKYVNLDYSSIPDSQAKLTEEDYKEYYNENKARFKNETENRTFEYVVFDASPSKADTVQAIEQINKLAAEFKKATNDSLFVSINADTKSPVNFVIKGQLDPALDSLVFNAANGSIVGPVFSNGSYKIAKVIASKTGPDSVKASHILLNPATEGGADKAKARADSLAGLARKGADFAALAKKFSTDGSKDQGGDLGTFGRGAMVPVFEDAAFSGKPGDIKVVTSQFGTHVIKIVSQTGSSRVVKAAVVDKALTSSNKTQQDAYAKASSFLGEAGNAKAFDDQAKKSNYNKLIAENITASQGAITGLENPRELVRWVYDADEGDVSSQVFDTGNKFVVAKVIQINEEGTQPLEDVKKQIEQAVRDRVKGNILAEKMDKARTGASSIEQVAQKVNRPVTPAQNVVFANPVVPGVGQENKVVGSIFGSQPGKLSATIKGERGVYIYVLNNLSKPAALNNTFKQKEQLTQTIEQRAANEAFKVLREKADIEDNRARFF